MPTRDYSTISDPNIGPPPLVWTFSICLFSSHPIITKFCTHHLGVSINKLRMFFEYNSCCVVKRAKVWFVTSADEMPSRSLYPSQKWQPCGESRRSTNHVCVRIWETNRAGCQNTLVTLRDSPNEGGGPMLGSLIVVTYTWN